MEKANSPERSHKSVLLWRTPESEVERSGLSSIRSSLCKCCHGPLKQGLKVELVSPSFKISSCLGQSEKAAG